MLDIVVSDQRRFHTRNLPSTSSGGLKSLNVLLAQSKNLCQTVDKYRDLFERIKAKSACECYFRCMVLFYFSPYMPPIQLLILPLSYMSNFSNRICKRNGIQRGESGDQQITVGYVVLDFILSFT